MHIWLALLLLAFTVSALLAGYLSRRRWALDQPNARSLHTLPTPKTGGLGILTGLAAALFAWLVINGTSQAWLWGGAALIAAVSLADDWMDVPPLWRLAAHFAAAALLIGGLGVAETLALPGLAWQWPAWLAWPLLLLFVVWMTNLYNFMDGMDGFAGGMAVFGFGAYAVAGLLAGQPEFTLINGLIAAAAAGFLWHNFPPAKIFMGDAGSATLGFLAAGLALWGERLGVLPLWAAVLIFSPFIVDATVTLSRRLLRGEKIWQAHRSHYYQRLALAGFGHRRTVLGEYLLMAGCGLTALVALRLPAAGQWLALLGWAGAYVGLMLWAERRCGPV